MTHTTKQLVLSPALAADMQAVEAQLMHRIESQSALITAAGQHIIGSGGKRLRAMMALVAAQLGAYTLEDTLHAATAVELIHAASLVHDDLIDDADRRRGRITVHTKWDQGVALMVGDYLFALAAGEMALAPDPRVIQIFSQAVMTISASELHPVLVITPIETAVEQYYAKIGGKTAALFEAAAAAGMVCGRGTHAEIKALAQYGYDIGLAFQIVDDILDFISDEATLGKPAGNDLREGTITLPLIYAVSNTSSNGLATLFDDDELGPEQVAQAIKQVEQLGGIERSIAEARRVLERGLAALDIFPPSPAKDMLYEIADYVV
ncbi:MAG: polyprenyl synthetase family protein, partial [Herpetosiphonaceae bacterium]|nr:polyprenyl synthetase family protein [Herpetosiphonaceae bacterium]